MGFRCGVGGRENIVTSSASINEQATVLLAILDCIGLLKTHLGFMVKMKRVVQREYEKGDCGVACIAMITSKPYEEVKRLFIDQGLVENGYYYTFHKDIISVLHKMGYEAKRKRFINWGKVESPAIVKINVRKGNYWHWVVKANSKNILDPKPSAPEIVTNYRGRNGSGQYLLITSNPAHSD